mmetsp:Transcript_56646/g.66207  ORF Transcript_56646/g.66207 Transcript_56646/m.66207 type:complete len:206 (+) Transcript_56646:1796-2413(+)
MARRKNQRPKQPKRRPKQNPKKPRKLRRRKPTPTNRKTERSAPPNRSHRHPPPRMMIRTRIAILRRMMVPHPGRPGGIRISRGRRRKMRPFEPPCEKNETKRQLKKKMKIPILITAMKVTTRMILTTTRLINLGKKGRKISERLVIDFPMTTTMIVKMAILRHDTTARTLRKQLLMIMPRSHFHEEDWLDGAMNLFLKNWLLVHT